MTKQDETSTVADQKPPILSRDLDHGIASGTISRQLQPAEPAPQKPAASDHSPESQEASLPFDLAAGIPTPKLALPGKPDREQLKRAILNTEVGATYGAYLSDDVLDLILQDSKSEIEFNVRARDDYTQAYGAWLREWKRRDNDEGFKTFQEASAVLAEQFTYPSGLQKQISTVWAVGTEGYWIATTSYEDNPALYRRLGDFLVANEALAAKLSESVIKHLRIR